ncbi:MAG: patatin [Flavipsychrobacter sp.]|nr:patatin [Flavipsychrobacter sp.]
MFRFLAIALLLLHVHILSAQQYKYLVLKGGGIRGIAYTGALKVLEEQNITPHIEKVAGTSVGAITGVLFCLGYSAKQMEDIMFGLNIKTFNDGRGYFIGGQKRVRKNYGWYRGNKLEQWIGKQIKEQTGNDNTTFLQLHLLAQKNSKFKDMYVTATNLTKQRLEIFSWETYPDMPVKTAVRASVSIPLYFGAVFMDSTGKIIEHPNKHSHYNVFADGGLLANYPITIFNSNHENTGDAINEFTLGLKLDRPEQIAWYENNSGIAPYDIQSFTGYLSALYNLTIEQLNKCIPYTEEKKHTIYISTSNLSPRVRHITKEQKQLLFNNGAEAAKRFFEEKK